MAAFSPENNDVSELMEKVSWKIVIGISFGRLKLDEVKQIVIAMNRVVINCGDGLTLLHIAAQYNRCDWIEYLCGEKHHPTELKTVVGETALDQSAWKGYGANIDCQTNGGYTPLHRCAFYKHERLASLFCIAGADQSIRDENNQTAYEVAVERKNKKIASLLKPIDGLPQGMYATNNPKHPDFRPEARESFFQLFDMESSLNSQAGEENEEEGEDVVEEEEDQWEDVDSDEEGEEGDEDEEGGSAEGNH